jgi:hypothetical protein
MFGSACRCRIQRSVRDLRSRNSQVLANLLGEVVVDFGVPWNSRCFSGGSVHENGVIGALAEQLATVPLGDGAQVHGVSPRELQSLADDFSAAGRLLDQLSIRLENQRNRFLKIGARFLEGRTLRIRAWDFLDKGNVPLGHLAENGCQLQVHAQ